MDVAAVGKRSSGIELKCADVARANVSRWKFLAVWRNLVVDRIIVPPRLVRPLLNRKRRGVKGIIYYHPVFWLVALIIGLGLGFEDELQPAISTFRITAEANTNRVRFFTFLPPRCTEWICVFTIALSFFACLISLLRGIYSELDDAFSCILAGAKKAFGTVLSRKSKKDAIAKFSSFLRTKCYKCNPPLSLLYTFEHST